MEPQQQRQERVAALTGSISPMHQIVKAAYNQKAILELTGGTCSAETIGLDNLLDEHIRSTYQERWNQTEVHEDDVTAIHQAILNYKLWCDIRLEPYTAEGGAVLPDPGHAVVTATKQETQQVLALYCLHQDNLALIADRCLRMDGLVPDVDATSNFVMNVMQFYETVYHQSQIHQVDLELIFHLAAEIFASGALDNVLDQATLAILDQVFTERMNETEIDN